MAEVDVEAGLKSLRASLRQIKSLMAWMQLKQAEAGPGRPPRPQIRDPTETELRDEYSFFLSISVQMHHILGDASFDIDGADRQSIKKKLAKIERQFNNLNLYQRFCRC